MVVSIRGISVWVVFSICTGISSLPVCVSAQEACFECHDDPEMATEDTTGGERSLFVDPGLYNASVHGDLACEDCHADIAEIPHPEHLQKVACGECHDDAASAYAGSVHSSAVESGAASCADCHGKHDILSPSDAHSRTHPLNLPATCARCHADPKVVFEHKIPVHDPLAAYKKSVHGSALLLRKNLAAPSCVSCHGSHRILSLSDPESPIYWKHVGETCGHCHNVVYQEYRQSVHGVAVQRGMRDAPVCTDCHGEHDIESPQNPESTVYRLRVAPETCERCHASEVIVKRYSLPPNRVRTYEDSYHGLAMKGGSLAAANCASCHGAHLILASSDPRSTVNPANLVGTCGKCHPDVTQNVAQGPVHLMSNTHPGRVVSFVKTIYIWLIVIVIGGMLVHNGLDFRRRAIVKLKRREAA